MDILKDIRNKSKEFIKGKDSTGHDAYAFTQNNFEKTFYQKPDKLNPNVEEGEITLEESIQRFAYNYCLYLTYGVEEAPSTGTPHLQGCFVLREATTLNCIKKRINNEIHVEKIKKPLIANIFYSRKQKDFIFTHCDPSYLPPIKDFKRNKYIPLKERKAAVNRYDLIKKQLLETGDILQLPFDYAVKNMNNLTKYKNLYLSKSVVKDLRLGSKYGDYHQNHFLWLCGKTGSLKSYNAHKVVISLYKWISRYNERHGLPLPDKKLWDHAFIKDTNKWFQDYNFEKVIIIEEATPEFCKNNVGRFKRWTDQFAFPVEVKGDSIAYIRPEFIIVTSNYTLEECFSLQEGLDYEKDYLPMKRRFFEMFWEEKNVLTWPSFKLLAIEYNQKRLVKEYDDKYSDMQYHLEMIVDDYKEDDDYTRLKITNPLVIQEYIIGFKGYIKLERAWQLYNENEDTIKKRNAVDVVMDNDEDKRSFWNKHFKSDVWCLMEEEEPPKCDFCDRYFCIDCRNAIIRDLVWFCEKCMEKIKNEEIDIDICVHCGTRVDNPEDELWDKHCKKCVKEIFKSYVFNDDSLEEKRYCLECFEKKVNCSTEDCLLETDVFFTDLENQETLSNKRRKLNDDEDKVDDLFRIGNEIIVNECPIHNDISFLCNHEECDKNDYCHCCGSSQDNCNCGRYVKGKRNKEFLQTFGVPCKKGSFECCDVYKTLCKLDNEKVLFSVTCDEICCYLFNEEVLNKYNLLYEDNMYFASKDDYNFYYVKSKTLLK